MNDLENAIICVEWSVGRYVAFTCSGVKFSAQISIWRLRSHKLASLRLPCFSRCVVFHLEHAVLVIVVVVVLPRSNSLQPKYDCRLLTAKVIRNTEFKLNVPRTSIIGLLPEAARANPLTSEPY